MRLALYPGLRGCETIALAGKPKPFNLPNKYLAGVYAPVLDKGAVEFEEFTVIG